MSADENSAVSEKLELKNEVPVLPHVESNQLPLNLVIRNLTVFTIKEISQFMKTNVHLNSPESNSGKKLRFLQLVIFLRNQFLKLYVLIKWCRTIKHNNFHVLIDLLNWFRTTNMTINNCIWALKNNLVAMSNAKLPNADLITALEVLSKGRPNLPTHNFRLSGEREGSCWVEDGSIKIPSTLILKRLHELNLNCSIKMCWMELPDQMSNYQIKNGRVNITVQNEFEIQLATTERNLPLFFVDFKFLFTSQLLPINKPNLEKVVNDILFRHPKPLFGLYNFLHKYVLTLQLHMMHLELLKLENGGKFFGGNLIHTYDSKRSIIIIRYWLNARMGNKGLIKVGFNKRTNNLILRWENKFACDSKLLPVVYTDILQNLENILDEIMFNHSQLIRTELLSKGIFQEDDESKDILLFQIPTTTLSVAPVQLKIDIISGIFYFKNPTDLLQRYAKLLNKAESLEELIVILQKLRLDKIGQILSNMFEKTGWTCSNVVNLGKPIKTPLNNTDNSTTATKVLQKDLFISLPNWPTHWYLILSIVSSNTACMVEKKIGKIMAWKGKWKLTYLNETNVIASKLENITYQKIMILQKTILHKITNHMIIDSLNQLKIQNRICSTEETLNLLPKCIVDNEITGSSMMTSSNANPACSSIIALGLDSFLKDSKATCSNFESSLFLKINYATSQIILYGKFKVDTMFKKCKSDNLMITFVPEEPLAFSLTEPFSDLNVTVQYLTKFKKSLIQLSILTDVVERLKNNFDSEHFKILELEPNQISFKYIEDDGDEADCTIYIITNDETIADLRVELSDRNPQYIIQPFISAKKLDYHFIFNYLRFTSTLFTAINVILNEEKNGSNSTTSIALGLHNLNEYQLIYFNRENGMKISLLIELRKVSQNRKSRIQYYIHFAEENLHPKSPEYSLVQKVIQEVFSWSEPHPESTNSSTIVKLINGVACDSLAVESVLMSIHNVLKGSDNSSTLNDTTSNLASSIFGDAIET